MNFNIYTPKTEGIMVIIKVENLIINPYPLMLISAGNFKTQEGTFFIFSQVQGNSDNKENRSDISNDMDVLHDSCNH